EEKDVALFPELNGLFSGLLIDRRTPAVHLFNDRYGVERLYVLERGDEVFFASEARAILAVAPDSRAFDPEGVAQYLAFSCTFGERTLFRHIQLLPGASRWTFNHATVRKHRYFFPAEWETLNPLSRKEFTEQLMETLARIVPVYADAPGRIGI